MKVGILAGGLGTRLAEETEIRPKPMVEIGPMPILWHIMMHYHAYGHREFADRTWIQGRIHQALVRRFCIAQRQHDIERRERTSEASCLLPARLVGGSRRYRIEAR